MVDGKLITLTNHPLVSQSEQSQYPLNGLPFYFHIPPSEISKSSSAEHAENNVVRKGAVSQFGGASLEEHSWRGEFLIDEWFDNRSGIGSPYKNFPAYFIRPPSGFQHYGAIEAYRLLRSIMQKGLVVWLDIQDVNTGKLEVHQPVTIRSISLSEVGGEPDTRSYSISLKQYRSLTAQYRSRSATPSTGTPRPSGGRHVKSPYRLKANMGVKRLALIAYRDKSKWKLIVKANGGSRGMFKRGALWRPTLKDGPYYLKKGQTYIIPPAQGK
jgi:hypothetical protein